MVVRFAALLLVFALSFAPAVADDLAGSVVTPVANLPLRASPPGSFFQGKGAEIGVATPSERFRVLEQTTVTTLAGSEDWLQIQSVTNPTLIGWVYSGPTGAVSPNVVKQSE